MRWLSDTLPFLVFISINIPFLPHEPLARKMSGTPGRAPSCLSLAPVAASLRPPFGTAKHTMFGHLHCTILHQRKNAFCSADSDPMPATLILDKLHHPWVPLKVPAGFPVQAKGPKLGHKLAHGHSVGAVGNSDAPGALPAFGLPGIPPVRGLGQGRAHYWSSSGISLRGS